MRKLYPDLQGMAMFHRAAWRSAVNRQRFSGRLERVSRQSARSDARHGLRLTGRRGSRVSHAQYVKNMSTQEEIDTLGGDKTVSAWEARFELAYEKCKEENVTLVGGVAPTAVRFARYLHRVHKVYPKELWNTQIVTLGSVPGINTRYHLIIPSRKRWDLLNTRDSHLEGSCLFVYIYFTA